MTLFQDNISPYISFVEGAAPGSPAATNFRLYYDSSDHLLKWKNSAGAVTIIATGTAMTNPMTTTGDIIYSSDNSGTPARRAVGASTTVLHGGTTPAYSAVLPADLDVSADNTTADATTGHHGLLPKLGGGTTNFLRADGSWAAAGSSGTGQPVAIVTPGYTSIATTTNSGASQAMADPVTITTTMKVRALWGAWQATSSGSMQWGLFDYSSNPASATSLVEGSAVISSTGWQPIAATSAPVTVNPGNYMLVTFNPAANSSTWHAAVSTAAQPFHQLYTSYTWTSTPDFTSASWNPNTTMRLWYLEGDLDGSGNRWT
jgi:hypothetical protein